MSAIHEWTSEFSFCSELGIRTVEYDYDQFSADEARMHLDIGTSACAFYHACQAPAFLCSGELDMSQQTMANRVNEFDGNACDGLYAAVALEKKLTECQAHHKILEGDPQDLLSQIEKRNTIGDYFWLTNTLCW